MKKWIRAISFLYLLTYLSNTWIGSSYASSDGNIILELEETPPTSTPRITPIISTPKENTQSPQLPSSVTIANEAQFLDFGFIVPGEPVLRTDVLHIMTQNTQGGISLFALQSEPLRHSDGSTVPDTTCDNGACNPSLSSVWNSLITYGYGFRCENPKYCLGSESENTYRPFSVGHPVLIANSNTLELKSIITYKLNLSASTPAKPYTNSVTYIAFPNF
jgi:hypothetical protein